MHVPSVYRTRHPAFTAIFYGVRTEMHCTSEPRIPEFIHQMACGNTTREAYSVTNALDVTAKCLVLQNLQ